MIDEDKASEIFVSRGETFDKQANYSNPTVIEGSIIKVYYKRNAYPLIWKKGDNLSATPINSYTTSSDIDNPDTYVNSVQR